MLAAVRDQDIFEGSVVLVYLDFCHPLEDLLSLHDLAEDGMFGVEVLAWC